MKKCHSRHDFKLWNKNKKIMNIYDNEISKIKYSSYKS